MSDERVEGAGMARGRKGQKPGAGAVMDGGRVAAAPARFEDLGGNGAVAGAVAEGEGTFDLVLGVPVRVTVELGEASMTFEQVLQLAQGSLIELGKMAGEPFDVLVNGVKIAEGEVVTVNNDRLGIRLIDIVSPDKRIEAR